MNDNVMDGAAFAQLLSNGNGNQWNNPFIYLIWMMFANQYMGGGNNANLQGLIQDNHNSDLLMSAVNGSKEAVQNLAIAMNANFDNVSQAICGVRNGITEANGSIALAAEKMLNGVNMQGQILGNNIQQGFCGVKTEILNQGYQNQLNNANQSNQILQGFSNLTNTVTNGFTQLGFSMQTEACNTRAASVANTQKIIDILNNHWQLEQQTTIQQLRDEVGRLNQNQYLVAQLKTTA